MGFAFLSASFEDFPSMSFSLTSCFLVAIFCSSHFKILLYLETSCCLCFQPIALLLFLFNLLMPLICKCVHYRVAGSLLMMLHCICLTNAVVLQILEVSTGIETNVMSCYEREIIHSVYSLKLIQANQG